MSSPLTAAIVYADACYQRLSVPHDDHEALLAVTREAIRRVDVALRLDPPSALHNKCQWQWDRMKPKITAQMRKGPELKKQQKDTAVLHGGEVLVVYKDADAFHAERLRESAALASELADLHAIQTEFGSLLHRDGVALSVAIDHVQQADHDVAKGVKELSIASGYKLAGMAVTGAVVGAIVGGPVGLLVGIKSTMGVAVFMGAGAATGAFTTSTVGAAVHANNVECVEALSLDA